MMNVSPFRKLLCAITLATLSQSVYAQGVGINDDNTNPDASAMLHVKSTNKGVLVPRMSTAQRTTIATPATGLLVFDLTSNSFWFFDGAAWTELRSGADNDNQDLSLTGNTLSLTNDGTPVNLTPFLDNTDNQDLNLAGNTLSLTNDGTPVNLTPFLDNTDNQTLSLTGNTLAIANGNSVNIPSGDINGVTAGDGLTGGGTTGNVTLNVVATNGITDNANDIRLGGALVQPTTITQGANNMLFNLNGAGDFHVQDNGNVQADNTTFFLDAANNRIGMGTTTPDNILDIYQPVGDPTVTIIGATNTDPSLVLAEGGTNPFAGGVIRYDGDLDGLTFLCQTAFPVTAERMFISRNTGNIGMGTTAPAQRLHVVGTTRISTLAGAGNRMVIANANGDLATQPITVGDITGVTAGDGLIGGGTTGNVTLNVVATNGLTDAANDVRLGGNLVQLTTINQGANNMRFNLDGAGDFHIQDAGVNHFSITDNGNTAFGGDVEWRDENSAGTILAQLIDDGDDGRFLIRENGNVSVDLDANTQFVFNEQGFDRDFRIESNTEANMFRVNAGTNRIGVGDANPTTRMEIGAADGQTLMLSRQDGAIAANEQLGGIGFDGSDGNTPTDIRESSASIIAFATEDHSTGDKGGRLTFWTSPTNQDDNTDGFERLRIDQNGTHFVGGDMFWRDASVTGTNIARIVDDGNDGQMIIYEDGITQILLDANGTSVFNERGLDRNVRIESDLDANNFFADGGTSRIGIGTGAPARKLHVVGTTRISTLAGAGNRMVIANANGDLATQAITVGDITAVTAGTGLTGGGTTGAVTVNVIANNGLTANANDVRLGGTLIQATTVTQGTNNMTFNLNSTGDFHVQDNGTNHFSITDNGNTAFGGDVEWRDENTGGTILAQLIDDGNDGRFLVRENGVVSIDLDANSQFIFNEQGLDRNFRVESDGNTNMMFLDAGLNRLGIGTATPDNALDVNGKLSITQSANDEMVLINDDIWRHGSGNQDFGDGGDHFFIASEEGSFESSGVYGDGDHLTLWSPGDAAPGQPAALIYVCDEDRYTGADTNPFNNNALEAYLNTAGNWVAASDKNRKENIVALDNSLSKILQIKGYSYNFKQTEEEIEKGEAAAEALGVIAQEVEMILPNVVEKSDDGDYYVSYIEFIPVLIEALKEEHAIVDSQKEEILTLKAQQDATQKELEEIKVLLKSMGK